MIGLCSLLLIGCNSESETSSPKIGELRSQAPTLADLERLAKSGDADAMRELGRRYDAGEGIEQDRAAAYSWFLKSAEAGNVDAIIEVASRLEHGNGVIPNRKSAETWWTVAAEKGSSLGQLKAARIYGSVFRNSLRIEGRTTDQKLASKEKYLSWLEKSVAQENPEAEFELGMALLLGNEEKGDDILERDLAKGVELLEKSANAKYWQAQWALGVLYQSGYRNIAPDMQKSSSRWEALKSQSNPKIQKEIGEFYDVAYNIDPYKDGQNKYDGKSLSYKETLEVAESWLRKSADQQYPEGLCSLAEFYRHESRLVTNAARAMELYSQAAKAGCTESYVSLGWGYLEGKGLARDYREGFNWTLKAANQGYSFGGLGYGHARLLVAALYQEGVGTPKDLVLAYAWYNLAASQDGNQQAAKNRDALEKKLTRSEIEEAQDISRNWVPGKSIARTGLTTQDENVSRQKSPDQAGTAFYVSPTSLLTNNHVIDGCKSLKISGQDLSATVKAKDPHNDLALLVVEGSNSEYATFPATEKTSQGEVIFAFGYPLAGYLSSTGNITSGIVSATSGVANNSSLFQITAPIQKGNSGGPILNDQGEVIGIVLAKANALKLFSLIGDIPENISFAINLRTIKSFLETNSVKPKTGSALPWFSKSSTQIADSARNFTYKVECWK